MGRWRDLPGGFSAGVARRGRQLRCATPVRRACASTSSRRSAGESSGRGAYLAADAALRYTAYSLDDVAIGFDDAPSRTAPILSLDTGLIFEREVGSHRQRLHTLEPRLLYLYVPFRDQDDLPVFDTALPDLNLVQLFRTNRYVGPDRLSDANQLAVGRHDAAAGRARADGSTSARRSDRRTTSRTRACGCPTSRCPRATTPTSWASSR